MFIPVLQSVSHSETHKIPYTFQRNGIYYLRIRIPKIIQEHSNLPPVIRQSLQTKSSQMAIALVNKVINQLNEMRSLFMANVFKQQFVTVMTFHTNGRPRSCTKYDSGNSELDASHALKHSLELNALEIENNLTSGSPDEAIAGMRLSEAIERYMKWKADQKGGMSDKVAKSRQRNLEVLLHVIGDKSVKAISKKDMRNVISVLQNMPKRNIKPYCDMKDLGALIELAKNREIPEDDVVSSKSVREAFKDYQSGMARISLTP